MILFHRVFRYSENSLLSNSKQLPYHFKCLRQETGIPGTGPFAWVSFPMVQTLDHQAPQTWTCRSAEVSHEDDLRPGLNLWAENSAQVSGVQQNNVLTDQPCAKLPS